MTKMALEDIKEVRECRTQIEVNNFLREGSWKLIDIRIEKLEKPVVIPVQAEGSLNYRKRLAHEEVLSVLYIVGRY